jgi:hypothetical protein
MTMAVFVNGKPGCEASERGALFGEICRFDLRRSLSVFDPITKPLYASVNPRLSGTRLGPVRPQKTKLPKLPRL